MTPNPASILENGRVKPGIYQIQNLGSETYLDIHRQTKELCCRPTQDLAKGEGLWEIKSLGAGYTVRRAGPGEPEQFCTPMQGFNDGTPVYVADYPIAWRIGVINQGSHRGFRFYLGSTRKTWDLHRGFRDNGTKVHFYDDADHTCQTWRLIPIRVEAGPDTLPPDDGNQTCTCAHQTTETTTNDDGLGITVVEVTVTTTTNTVTTRKKYRIED